MKFTDILEQYNIPVGPKGHHHSRSGWVQFDCPHCASDTHKWHMGYSLAGNYVNCWRCGPHRLIETLCELTQLSFRECKKLIDGLDVSKFEKVEIKGKLEIPEGVGKLLPVHEKYLWFRNYDWRQLQQLWQIKGIGVAGYFSWRIFIPIIYRGQTVSWTTRSMLVAGVFSRYITAKPEQEAIHHKKLLYGEDYARHAIVITEGPFDVWRIGPGAVCTFGVNFTQAQIEKMIRYPTRAVCFDNNKDAQRRANQLCDQLSVFPGETFNVVLDSKDPGEASAKEITKLRKRVFE